MAVDRLETPKRPVHYPYSHAAPHVLGTSDLRLHGTHGKGKQRESDDFHFGWWDYTPLLEQRRPPVHWTSSSLIVTAHPSEPRVTCLHFPSNIHFTLPDPPPLTNSPTSYEPPTIISASSRDDWIFAYFPGIDIDGIGCFWNKTRLVDDWIIKEWRTFARGDGVVAAQWLNSDREWSTSEAGTPTRLPALGPFIPSLYPVLLTVTEAHLCNIFYLIPQTERVHMLSASLSRRSFSRNGQERPDGEVVEGPRGLGRCVHAAIGLGYDESSVLISTYSAFVPSEPRPQGSADVNLSLNVPMHVEPALLSNWEIWRDENIIDLCEVNISVKGFHLSLATTPLPSIRDFFQSGRSLTNMTFVPCLPSPNNQLGLPATPTQTHRRVTPQSSPATVPAHVSQSPGRTILRSPAKVPAPKPIPDKAKVKPSGPLYLLCTTLEVGQYTSTPTSDVILYFLRKNPADMQTWYFKRINQTSLPGCVVVHSSSYQPTITPMTASVLIGTLSHQGQLRKRKAEHLLAAGKMQIWRLPELQIDDNWESVDIICPIGSTGVELPFSFAASPSRTLVCAIPISAEMSLSAKASTFIHQHPLRILQSNHDTGPHGAKRLVAASIEIALQRRFFPGDIIHSLCNPNTPISSVEDALITVLHGFDANNTGMTRMSVNEIVGMAIDIYRRRSSLAEPDADTEDLRSHCQTGLEILSLAACNIIWEDSFDHGVYDPASIWDLISLCGYFVEEFLENLLKECVQFASEISSTGNFGSSADSNKEDTSIGSLHLASSLLHLVHPYALDALRSFVVHVRRFRGFLGSNRSTKGEEKHQVAREILFDSVDSSPVDLEALDRVLGEVKPEVHAFKEQSPEIARRGLALLKPTPQHIPLLRKIIQKLMQAHVVDKLQLFIKPAELVDGMVGLSVSQSGKVHERNIITKGYLTGQGRQLRCLRCSGKSEIDEEKTKAGNKITLDYLRRWTAWERTWQTRCVCGGLWASNRK